MSTSHDESHPEAIGEKVLTAAVASARDVWGERLVAAYALGSLAHGGFSIHVSDIDLGLILADPLEDQDTAASPLSVPLKRSHPLPVEQAVTCTRSLPYGFNVFLAFISPIRDMAPGVSCRCT